MTRPTGHAAARPFRITQTAIEAHQAHRPTPFFGCPLCAQRVTKTSDVRWMSPRHA